MVKLLEVSPVSDPVVGGEGVGVGGVDGEIAEGGDAAEAVWVNVPFREPEPL